MEGKMIAIVLLMMVVAVEPNALPTTTAPSTTTGCTQTYCTIGSVLSLGSKLISPRGHFVLAMQHDGNLVLYCRNRTIWDTKTTNTQIHNGLYFQPDGNLVLYRSNNQAVWASGTRGKPAKKLILHDDGNLVLYGGTHAYWSTQTHGVVCDDQFRYKFDKRKMSWSDSEKECVKWGGHLATIHSQTQNDHFVSELKTRNMNCGWIGLSDSTKEGMFKWIDTAAHCNYINWRMVKGHHSEPNGGTKENCVEIIPGREYWKDWKGTWNDIHCTDKKPFICEKRALEYKFDTRAMSWSNSEKECQRLGGHLATISSQTQNDDFVSELKKRNMVSGWIGLSDSMTEGSFKWVGSAVRCNYTNWRILGANREPNGGKSENCVEIIPGVKYGMKDWKGKWNDRNCTAKYPFICETPILS